MLINFPNQLTSEEEQLLKKIAKMKKKKKNYSEKKAQIKETEASTSNVTAAAAALKLKRTNSGNYAGTQLDAKEQAKKLVQSGLIKLETENKEKGFKRSCSRKDDSKKTQLNLNPDVLDPNRPVTYSSINSPNSSKSPGVSSPYFGSNNKFSFSDNQPQHSPSYNNNFNNNRGGGGAGGGYRKNNSFQNNYNNQDNRNNFRFQAQRQNSQPQQQQGVSLFVKANNVTEELLRSIFNANVPNAKVLSIDIKTNFAFVSVDSSESANNAILELNGKTFQDNLYSVSLARPRKTFNRNNTYNSNYDRSNSNPNNNNNNNNNNSANFNVNSSTSSPSKNSNDPNRQIINYEDI